MFFSSPLPVAGSTSIALALEVIALFFNSTALSCHPHPDKKDWKPEMGSLTPSILRGEAPLFYFQPFLWLKVFSLGNFCFMGLILVVVVWVC